MKVTTATTIGSLFAVLVSSSDAFSTSASPSSITTRRSLPPSPSSSLAMFSGAGEGVPNEDNPEELAKMEQVAKQLGMSVEEYKLGMSARVRMTKEIDEARLVSGDTATVAVERDGNNPPKHLEITITDAGKALGKDVVESKLVEALKESEEASRAARVLAQKNMMTFVGEEMKKVR